MKVDREEALRTALTNFLLAYRGLSQLRDDEAWAGSEMAKLVLSFVGAEYEEGYRNGESSGYADWHLALDLDSAIGPREFAEKYEVTKEYNKQLSNQLKDAEALIRQGMDGNGISPGACANYIDNREVMP